MGIKIAAAAKAVAATVEGIAEVIAAGGWVVLLAPGENRHYEPGGNRQS